MKSWGEIKCWLDLHDRVTICSIRCQMWSRNVLTGRAQSGIPGIARITRCRRCGIRGAWITDGCTTQSMDLDELLIMVPSLQREYETLSEVLSGVA